MCNIGKTRVISFFVILEPREELRGLWRATSVKPRGHHWDLIITDRFFKVGNNVVAVLLLLETSKGHGRTRNVLD